MCQHTKAALAALAVIAFGVYGVAQASPAAVSTKATVTAASGWTRVSLPYLPGTGQEFPLLTVPADAKRFFLRQTQIDRHQTVDQNYGVVLLPTSGCTIYANGMMVAPLMSNATDLRIPFAAGDVLTVRCDFYGRGYSQALFVFSD